VATPRQEEVFLHHDPQTVTPSLARSGMHVQCLQICRQILHLGREYIRNGNTLAVHLEFHAKAASKPQHDSVLSRRDTSLKYCAHQALGAKAGALKCTPLAVSGAFHTRLMEPARDQLVKV